MLYRDTCALSHAHMQDMLESTCNAKGLDYNAWLAALRKNNQWHVEVY